MRTLHSRVVAVITLVGCGHSAIAQEAVPAPAAAVLSDPELAQVTGKFLLPNGVEIALSVTSDTVVNGQPILRTVLTVDRTSQLQVFGRAPGAAALPTSAAMAGPAANGAATGVTVLLDRQSGILAVTPTFSTTRAAGSAVTVNVAPSSPESIGLTALPLTAGGAPVTTADGVVSLQAVRNGTQVTLSGDRLAVADLVGSSIATAVVNSANDRVIDTVTNVAIDLHNAMPYQIGSAQMRVDALAVEAGRGFPR